jgi:hypothetical protein
LDRHFSIGGQNDKSDNPCDDHDLLQPKNGKSGNLVLSLRVAREQHDTSYSYLRDFPAHWRDGNVSSYAPLSRTYVVRDTTGTLDVVFVRLSLQ